jgi:hypothetical protein
MIWNVVLVGNVGPKMTMWRGVIWPRDSLLLGGRGREPREPRERVREGERGLSPLSGTQHDLIG